MNASDTPMLRPVRKIAQPAEGWSVGGMLRRVGATTATPVPQGDRDEAQDQVDAKGRGDQGVRLVPFATRPELGDVLDDRPSDSEVEEVAIRPDRADKHPDAVGNQPEPAEDERRQQEPRPERDRLPGEVGGAPDRDAAGDHRKRRLETSHSNIPERKPPIQASSARARLGERAERRTLRQYSGCEFGERRVNVDPGRPRQSPHVVDERPDHPPEHVPVLEREVLRVEGSLATAVAMPEGHVRSIVPPGPMVDDGFRVEHDPVPGLEQPSEVVVLGRRDGVPGPNLMSNPPISAWADRGKTT